jgi:hypothetical protein
MADSRIVASFDSDTTRESSTQASGPAENATTAADADQAKLERDTGREADLPPALGRHLERLKRAMSGNDGEGPAGSAAEWKFRA